jgi:hypothetical protein
MCFIGHGAFGIITKAAWLPYFAVAGIPESIAWRMMPIIGTIDILAGTVLLVAPLRVILLYMTVWGAWTALLRPLAGESVFEALERAGNYGVPLALLLIVTSASTFRVRKVLRWTTSTLLLAHGALGIIGKPILGAHYAAIGLPVATVACIGWFECALGVLVAIRPSTKLLVFVAVWKLATESLYLVNGQPVWEFVERGGSYAAPLALAVMLMTRCEGQIDLVEAAGVEPASENSGDLATTCLALD